VHEGRGQQYEASGVRALEQLSRLGGAGREWLLHQHVAPRRQCGTAEVGVRPRRGENRHQVDVLGSDHLLGRRDEPDARPTALQRRPDLAPPRADRALTRQSSRHEPVERLKVGGQDVARADEPDTHRTS
jgi:hypothetical protein